ncbi:MAG: DUF2974 domain-containing protein [Candidatus Gastranaerophilales bacterium]|nr:DUF2974 domain-containing protein [Candidatus Gastranaerophilales bacterium]
MEESSLYETLAAKLADFSYYDFEKLNNGDLIFGDSLLADWRFYQSENVSDKLKESVFCAVNKILKQIYIVFRGSEPSFLDIEQFLKDWCVSDLKMLFGQLPLNFEEFFGYVEEIKKEFSDYEIMMTGHSLGGSVAQLIGAVKENENIKTYTFNAFGTKQLGKCLEEKQIEMNYNPENIKNFRVESDVVSNRTEHFGAVYTVEYNKELGQILSSILKETPKIFVNLSQKVVKSAKAYLKGFKYTAKTLDSHFMNNFKDGYHYKKED